MKLRSLGLPAGLPGYTPLLFAAALTLGAVQPLESQTGADAAPVAALAVAASEEAAPHASLITDEERSRERITGYDLDVHLRPAEQMLTVRAHVQVRNTWDRPLEKVVLQLSSSLTWQSAAFVAKGGSRSLAVEQALTPDDADHTGQANELVVRLPQPLQPGEEARLDLMYAGKVELTAQRLEAIGSPAEAALHSDWDRISGDFTGLRGFGNVLWYPVVASADRLGDGNRLFEEIGKQKKACAGVPFKLALTVEYLGQAPDFVAINGVPMVLDVEAQKDVPADVERVGRATLTQEQMNFDTPSLFVARRLHTPWAAVGSAALESTALDAWIKPGSEPELENWRGAASTVEPFLLQWIGSTSRRPLTLLELPEAADAPFETGALLASGLDERPATELTYPVAHAMSHAIFRSPHPWLNEGVAQFMATLWLEHVRGRQFALSTLNQQREALALTEPAVDADDPAHRGATSGQPLYEAWMPVFYRTKASWVLWMLRDIAGDDAISAALRAYDPGKDGATKGSPGYFESLVTRTSDGKDLRWFFRDWVDTDHGLPEISFVGIYPVRSSVTDSWIVAVTLKNDGPVAAEVPVQLRSSGTVTNWRQLVPAFGQSTHRELLKGSPEGATANDGGVPETTATTHTYTLTMKPPDLLP